MQSITLQSHVGKDGILRLQVPPEFNDTDVRVTLDLGEIHQNGVSKLPGQDQSKKTTSSEFTTIEEIETLAQSNGWPPGFFRQTAGCMPDFPEIDFEGDYETREE
ncbi:MAG: hypothetical protein ACKVZH_13440 [Blastocatellia bacterium]